MNILNHIWPWKRFRQYRKEIDALQSEVLRLQIRYEAERENTDRQRAVVEEHKGHIRKLGEILAMKAGISITLLFLSVHVFAQPVLRNNVTTNVLAPSPADGWPLLSSNSVPVYSANGGAITNVTAIGVNGGNGPSGFILRDNSGNIFCVMTNGLAYWSNAATGLTITFTNGSGVFQGGITAATMTNTGVLGAAVLATDANGNIIAGTPGSGLNLLDPTVAVIVEEFPNQNTTDLQIGTHGWKAYKLGGGSFGNYEAPGTGGHVGVVALSTGTTSGDGAILMLGGLTNSTSITLFPRLDNRGGWTNTWIFNLSPTNDCVVWMGLENDLTYITTEPNHWMGMQVDSANTNTFNLKAVNGGTTSGFADRALDTSYHTFNVWSSVSGTISMQIDAGTVRTFTGASLTTLTLNPFVVCKKSANTASVFLGIDYYKSVITGLARN